MPYIIEYYTCFFTILLVSEISLLFIFQHCINLCCWAKRNNTYFKLISCLIFIFLIIFSLSYPLYECLTNIVSIRIWSCSQFSSILTWLAYLQYFLISISSCFLAISRSVLLIAHLYLLTRSTRLSA